MPIATRLAHYIDRKELPCQTIHHARAAHLGQALENANLVPELCVKAIPLIDGRGVVLVVIPYLSDLDLPLINKTLNRRLQVLPNDKADRLFVDCEAGAYPALGMAYGLPVIADYDMLDNDFFLSASGACTALIKMNGSTFRRAMAGAIKAKVAIWREGPAGALGAGLNATNANMTLDGVAHKLQSLYKLPPMPATAVRILHITSDPESSVDDLAQVIEPDPSLTAQVMRYAKSAYFAYAGSLDSVKDAVHAVLGFDRVSQLALGIASARAFSIPGQGALGLSAFWRHAIYCATLAQALADTLPSKLEVNPKQAYLAGLLHNFGILLVGHLFPPEFKMLNKLRESVPDAPMRDIERQVFGMGGAQDVIALGHGTIGGILLGMWQLPEHIVKTAAMHQSEHYTGEHQAYVKLIQLANTFLTAVSIGDERIDAPQAQLLDELGLAAEPTHMLAMQTIEKCQGLESMIQSIAAP